MKTILTNIVYLMIQVSSIDDRVICDLSIRKAMK
jgi:hypothetical protein